MDDIEKPLIKLTDTFTEKLATLKAKEEDPNSMLRIAVSGGGCTGFQYAFAWATEMEDGDQKVEKDGVSVVVDPMSIQYLDGAELDYVEELQASQFVVKNPNATNTCGCGSSFSV